MIRRIGLIVFLAAASSASLSSLAAAQETQTNPPAEGAEGAGATGEPRLEAVVVTGSRIARSTFETPTPITALSEKDLEAKAATSAIDLLRDIPSLRPNQIVGGGRSIGTSNFNMRSLGPTRTLVLLDGERLMDSSPVGGFDINVIPAALISRMEIVTAGASSVYGSDAVTGVVNVILNNKLRGTRADLQYDASTHGDQKTVAANLVHGTSFADGRGNIIFAGSYLNRPDLLYQGERSWGRAGYTLLPNAAYTPTNGQFRQLIVPDARLSQMTYGGLITTAGPLRNTQFGANGAQSLFVQGTNVGSVWMQGGDGLLTQPTMGIVSPSIKQESGFTRATYDVTPDIEVRVDFLGTYSQAHSTNNFNYNNGDITIRRDNAFLPANIRQAMIDNNLQSIRIGRVNPELGINYNTSTNRYYRSSAGLKGALAGDWIWDLAAAYTRAIAENTGEHNRNNANWNRALDSVLGPNGQPICRSTLTAPNDGCVPANVFGLGTVSQAVVDYVTGTSSQHSVSHSVDVGLNFTGSLGATWAGPIKVAAGIENRNDGVDSKSDPISDINGWRQGTFASYRGSVRVREGYGEASIPLASQLAFARSLDLDLAGRAVDYSTSGSTTVWKVGLNWALNESIRLRGTYSKDFRAPRIDDLFSASSLRAGNSVVDFVNNTVANVNTLAGGNPDLQPETAHTLTAGFVLTPSFVQGLQFSADYFDIVLEDAITVPTAQEVVDRCGRGDQAFCAAIIRGANGTITQVGVTAFNSQTLKTSGIDLETSYQFPLAGGDIGMRVVATYVDKLTTSTGGPAVDTAGQLTGTFATPKWRGSATLSYAKGPFNVRALFNLVGAGKYNNAYGPLDINRNSFGSAVYTDLSMQYDVTDNLQFYSKVENLFDKAPPLLSDNTITVAQAASSQFFDQRGRVFGVGVRYRL